MLHRTQQLRIDPRQPGQSLRIQPVIFLLSSGSPQSGARCAHAPRSLRGLVSQESSPDIVQEALSLGTCGYVVKGKAEHDLLAIVDAVLEGSQFLSGTLAGASY